MESDGRPNRTRRGQWIILVIIAAIFLAKSVASAQNGPSILEASNKTFKTKLKIIRNHRKNKEVPLWLRVKLRRAGTTRSRVFNNKRRHWRVSKLKI
ncbi:hypothetical protein AAMO2058_000957100 [Amorphochlora amoebiformis]